MTLRILALLALALGMAACAAKPPAPPPRAATPLPPPPPPPPPVRAPIHAVWRFQQLPAECRAIAGGGHVSLTIVARPARPVLLVMAPAPQRRLALRFAGPAGTWELPAAPGPGHAAIASFGPGDIGLSRLLIMLSGGTIGAEHGDSGLPAISLPPTGAAGSAWFGCVRHIGG